MISGADLAPAGDQPEAVARIDEQLAALRRTKRLVREALAACEAGCCEFSS